MCKAFNKDDKDAANKCIADYERAQEELAKISKLYNEDAGGGTIGPRGLGNDRWYEGKLLAERTFIGETILSNEYTVEFKGDGGKNKNPYTVEFCFIDPVNGGAVIEPVSRTFKTNNGEFKRTFKGVAGSRPMVYLENSKVSATNAHRYKLHGKQGGEPPTSSSLARSVRCRPPARGPSGARNRASSLVGFAPHPACGMLGRMTALPRIFQGLEEAEVEHSEFELRDPAESDENIEAWLGALPRDGTRFIVFAQDGTGSLFCSWLRPGQDSIEAAPVVYLGSEGELGVLGKDPAAFLEFIASGMTFDGHGGNFFDSLDDEEDEEFLAEGRERKARALEFLRRQTGRETARHPDALRAEAEAAYPDLAAWIAANNTRG